jgi:plasmid stability protein
MPAIHVRDVPPEVVAALKQRAARNDRSLEGEVRQILAAASREARVDALLPPLELIVASNANPRSTFQRDEIYGDDGR